MEDTNRSADFQKLRELIKEIDQAILTNLLCVHPPRGEFKMYSL